MKKRGQKTLTLKTLTKSNVWDLQENDIFRLWNGAQRDADLKDNAARYMDIIKSAFMVEEVKIDKPEVIKKYEARGCKVGEIRIDDNNAKKWALQKKAIKRVSDLTYDNIHHITAAKLIEVLDRNFGGGWESLTSAQQAIIENGFEVSTTTLPTDRLKKKGGLYDMKVKDGFEVLEIAQGSWTEAIFVKEKPEEEPKPAVEHKSSIADLLSAPLSDDEDDDADLPEEEESYGDDEDDDTFDEEKLTEESYRTTFDENPEDLDLEAADVSDDDDF